MKQHPGELNGTMDIGFSCFNRKSLETILPHRGAALRKIDGAFYSYHSPGVLTGIKEIHSHDEDMDGHFPGDPIYPGYAQDEFACLVAAALISLSIKGLKNDPYVIQKNARYKTNAMPGDTLTAKVTLHAKKTKFCMFSAEIRNQKNELIAEYEKIVGAV